MAIKNLGEEYLYVVLLEVFEQVSQKEIFNLPTLYPAIKLGIPGF